MTRAHPQAAEAAEEAADAAEAAAAERKRAAVGAAAVATTAAEAAEADWVASWWEGALRRRADEAAAEERGQKKDEQRAAITLSNLANLATHQRHFEAAIRWHEECLTLLRRLGETHDLTLALNNFAHTLFLANQDADVLRVLAEVFRVSGTMGSRRALVQGMSIAAALAARISDAGRAALLLGFQDAQREEAQIPLPESARESDLQLRSDLIETLGTRGYSEALTAGRGLETEEAIALAAHYSLPEVRTEG
ncbi:MAG: hypothetical protein V4671_15460 [Armatimonadota bacterium]